MSMNEDAEKPHHVGFAPTPADDTADHDSQRERKLESPPPPPDLVAATPPHPRSSLTYSEDSRPVPGSVVTFQVIGEDDKLRGSTRSSTSSGGTGTGSSKFSSRQLRGNLTRTQKNRDPLAYYEITQVLGVGSMGSVARVKKRSSAIGGSARKAVQERVKMENRVDACFRLPLVGGLFQFCLKAQADAWLDDVSVRAAEADASVGGGTVTTVSPSDMMFAMKSIHLSRITDETFVEELRNEIEILKSLDHPHIVKAIETFDHRNQLFVIMELCSGGDLYSRDPYTEEEAARLTSSILGAISYMHSKGM